MATNIHILRDAVQVSFVTSNVDSYRAAQKLNLSSKKKKQRTTPSLVSEPPLFSTNFCGILQTCPPPAPPCLLRAVNKVKDTPGLGKVRRNYLLHFCVLEHYNIILHPMYLLTMSFEALPFLLL